MGFDLALFHLVNSFCGNWALDRIARFEENNYFFKGGIFLTAYWWFWFSGEGEQRRNNRRVVIAAIVGALVALTLNRVMSAVLPFRIRPMYVPGIGYHVPSVGIPMNMENWSSFPSDSATFWFALAFGLFRLYRPLGIVCMIYSTVWMCLSRLYLGMHYPSDLIAGAALGTSVVWMTEKAFAASGRTWIGAYTQQFLYWLHRLELTRPKVFYAVAFLVSFELTVMFDDLRNGVRGVLHALKAVGFLYATESAALFVLLGGGVVVIATTAGLAAGARRRMRRPHTEKQLSRSL